VSSVVRPSAVVSEGAEGTAAQAYWGETVKPINPIDETEEPIRTTNNRKEIT
jgi:hypothetical protein